MKALITGASSGLGKEFAIKLSIMGYDIIAVAHDTQKLEELKKVINTNLEIISLDLSVEKSAQILYEKVKDDIQNIHIVINNAGFGVFGKFDETELEKELDMIHVNVLTVHSLMKLFLKEFKKRNQGYILNVASSAAFFPGPLMASYYATKAYVLRLTEAVQEELRREKSNVYIGVFCPGPVNTNFNNVAGVRFTVKALEAKDAAYYALKCMAKRKKVIVPGMGMKLVHIFGRLVSENISARFAYNIQKSKGSKNKTKKI